VDASRFTINPNRKRKKFSAVYCGVLSEWINYDLFFEIISENPDMDFHVIGKPFISEAYKRLMSFPNVSILGEKSPEEIVDLLGQYHVGLGFYKTLSGLDGDSMKLYEYLAAGLPVLCTEYHAALRNDFDDLLFLCNNSVEFNRALSDLKSGNLKNDQADTDAFLERSSWNNRISVLFDKLWN
ncbi:MAG TPA: hypothetical protein VG847_09650, partial [Chitinophagaceae bacterium]|nr:hypothetical protein [Chitinophagaceae bacterium]